MLEILERYLIKLQDAGDVRNLIQKDFSLENISELRRQQEIEAALKQSEEAPDAAGHRWKPMKAPQSRLGK
jgi:hypothetical protein